VGVQGGVVGHAITLGQVPDVLLPELLIPSQESAASAEGSVVESGVSPTARALLALELIQGSPGITADQLAGRLGVSERAARRYAGILREAATASDAACGCHR
jgi:hypothetical protein